MAEILVDLSEKQSLFSSARMKMTSVSAVNYWRAYLLEQCLFRYLCRQSSYSIAHLQRCRTVA